MPLLTRIFHPRLCSSSKLLWVVDGAEFLRIQRQSCIKEQRRSCAADIPALPQRSRKDQLGIIVMLKARSQKATKTAVTKPSVGHTSTYFRHSTMPSADSASFSQQTPSIRIPARRRILALAVPLHSAVAASPLDEEVVAASREA